MDSGNSGSMQSSSGGGGGGGGGDEEYDSRSESISPFFNPSSFSFGSIANHPQQPPSPPPPPPHTAAVSHQQNFPPTLFDPQAHTLGPLPNLDLVWTRGGLGRSEPNYTDLGNLIGVSSLPPSSSSSQSLLGVQGPNHGGFSTDGKGINTGRAAPGSDQTNVGKSSRKRTRASRRAPTTVLTTDTLNFRQMVQEFTGIPAPPFSSSPHSSRRLDLFGGGGGGGDLRSGHLETTLGPLYPFRPSAQKLQPFPFASSSSSPSLILKNSTVIDSAMASTSHDHDHDGGSTNPTLITSMAGPRSGPATGPGPSNTFSTASNYQLAPDLDLLPKQPQLMLNIQNPVLTFQSLLQSPLKYPLTKPSLDDDQFGGFSSGF